MNLRLILLYIILLVGCSNGSCRETSSSSKNSTGVENANQQIGPVEKVKVFKYDGSLQCGQGKSIAIEDMQKDLKSIKVYSAAAKTDGLMHMQVCGSATGKANVYEIEKKDLTTAKSYGFKEWLWE